MFLPPSTRTPQIVRKMHEIRNSLFQVEFKFAGCKERIFFFSLASCKLQTMIADVLGDRLGAFFPKRTPIIARLRSPIAPARKPWRRPNLPRSPSGSRAPRGRIALLVDTSDSYHRRGHGQRPIFASELLTLHRRHDGGHSRGMADGCRWQPTRRHSRRRALASVPWLRLVRSAHAAAQRPPVARVQLGWRPRRKARARLLAED